MARKSMLVRLLVAIVSGASVVVTVFMAPLSAQATGPALSDGAAPGWSRIYLGSLGGGTSWIAEGHSALNDRGQVVGSSATADGRVHAFLWDPRTGMRDLTPGAPSAIARAVNDKGEVVGVYQTVSGTYQGFVWTPGQGLRDIPVNPFDINNRGEVVGGGGAMWSSRGGLVPFGAPEGSTVTAYDLNDSSQAVGVYYSEATGGSWRAFSWSRRIGWTDIGSLADSTQLWNVMAFDINAHGVVAGTYNVLGEERVFRWDARQGSVDLGPIGGSSATAEGIADSEKIVVWNGTVVDRGGTVVTVGTLGGFVHAEAVNARGVVVGQSATSTGESHAFVWSPDGGTTDLGPSFGPVQYSYDTIFVNSRGQVAFTSSDTEQVVLWTPR